MLRENSMKDLGSRVHYLYPFENPMDREGTVIGWERIEDGYLDGHDSSLVNVIRLDSGRVTSLCEEACVEWIKP